MLQLADLHTDNEDVQRSVQQLKKKCQKLTAELQDTKLHLEGLQSRNHDLEKKQRKSVSVCPSVSYVFFHGHIPENRFRLSLWTARHRHCDPLRRTLTFSLIRKVTEMFCNLWNCIS